MNKKKLSAWNAVFFISNSLTRIVQKSVFLWELKYLGVNYCIFFFYFVVDGK
jgi:hypothetical protein